MAEEEENENATDEDAILIVLGVNVWLKGKGEPLLAFMRVRFSETAKPDSLEELTDSYANIILHQMSSRTVFALTLEDDRENRFIIDLGEIQAVQVIAPEVMPEVLRKDET